MRVFNLLFLSLFLASCAVPLDQINAPRPTASVVLRVQPEDARVSLDGVFIGRARMFDGTKRSLEITPGGHVLQFEDDDFENEVREIVARDGPQTLVVKMIPKPEPRRPVGD